MGSCRGSIREQKEKTEEGDLEGNVEESGKSVSGPTEKNQ